MFTQICFESAARFYFFGTLIRHQTRRDFRHRLGGGTVLDSSPMNPEYKPFTSSVGRVPVRSTVENPSSPTSSRTPAASAQPSLVTGNRAISARSTARHVVYIIIEIRQRHSPVRIVHPRNQVAQHLRGIVQRAAGQSGMQVLLWHRPPKFRNSTTLRKPYTMLGRRWTPSANPRSSPHRTLSFSLCSVKNGPKFGEPISSSPSTITLTLIPE